MCPIKEHTFRGESVHTERSANGCPASSGPTGELSPSMPDSGRMVRHHKGLSTISVSTLLTTEDAPGTFSALKRADLEGYMVTLSCVLTNSQYSALISMLETTPTMVGDGVSVGVKFAPMTPNLVQPSTAPST